jgi:hypothetical protein
VTTPSLSLDQVRKVASCSTHHFLNVKTLHINCQVPLILLKAVRVISIAKGSRLEATAAATAAATALAGRGLL